MQACLSERKNRVQRAKQEGRPAEISLWKRAGVPDRVESFGEVDSSENCLRAQPGFVEPFQNGLRKEQNLI